MIPLRKKKPERGVTIRGSLPRTRKQTPDHITIVNNYNMAKRSAGPDDSSHRKRPKITETTGTTKTGVPVKEQHEIRSSQDLQLLLAFDQDVGPAPRQSKNH